MVSKIHKKRKQNEISLKNSRNILPVQLTGDSTTVVEYFGLVVVHFEEEDLHASDEPAGADSDVLASSSRSRFYFHFPLTKKLRLSMEIDEIMLDILVMSVN